jgi:hypothetical protein
MRNWRPTRSLCGHSFDGPSMIDTLAVWWGTVETNTKLRGDNETIRFKSHGVVLNLPSVYIWHPPLCGSRENEVLSAEFLVIKEQGMVRIGTIQRSMSFREYFYRDCFLLLAGLRFLYFTNSNGIAGCSCVLTCFCDFLAFIFTCPVTKYYQLLMPEFLGMSGPIPDMARRCVILLPMVTVACWTYF